jgi:hypothetical protein
MQRASLAILACLSVLVMRISGVHLHACFGSEAPESHPSTHLADSGLLFGEHHSSDDSDDLELDLPDSRSAKVDQPPSLDLPSHWHVAGPLVPAMRTLEVPPARGPPPLQLASHFELTPPAQAPPALS